eukprot:5189318-Lingulodinium_polyedra.AAC.1
MGYHHPPAQTARFQIPRSCAATTRAAGDTNDAPHARRTSWTWPWQIDIPDETRNELRNRHVH